MTKFSQPTEFKLRTFSILLALPPFLFLIVYHDLTLIAVFAALSVFTFQEYMQMVHCKIPHRFTNVLITIAMILFYLSFLYPHSLIPIGWYIFFILLVWWSFYDRSRIVERISFFFFGIVYCIGLPFFWIKTGLDYGRWILVGFACIVWLNDIGAYLVGKKWGQHKIAPAISPGKSWEGLWGGIALSCGGALFLKIFFLSGWTVYQSLLIGLIIAVVGFIGDLFESSMKREYQLKDSGQFLPGHGGFLDRFDSFFFVAPMIYFIQTWWGG
ncbi:MAG TPA: phosphatidate cytidylyltransferase [Atribacter sp.]|uniref:phosphatidate cytidylyltransferase n=1 Tax=Atribacter sp. TaxID=2847780 RepID=UPI002C1339BD|nr:phosphatidate cytidylyltransferase [Atribacter sp.]MDD3713238.1 phosphatidate cytidylyltransferase [Atribacterota bacterium]MDI9595756.1 phosphatidate cytidylyltransferase [Atribacterota bacterium]HQK82539.1 phosphatidate cytidylyltransferase [Atribacter sp.]